MMHNTHEIKHRSFIAHNHHRAGGYSHSNGHGHEGTPSDPFIPPRIITNDSLYQALPISTDSRAHTRASGRNVSAGHAGHLFLNEFQPYEVPGSRGASADGRSRNLQSGSGSRGSSFPSHQQGGGLGLGEQQPASVTVDSYLDYPLADVGSELPMGANFRRLMDHVQATEYKMNTTVEEKISSIAGDLGSNSVPGQDFRLIDVPITPEMFMVKLASTLNEWRSGSTPEHYEDLITPLVNNNNGNTERRLNASVGVGGMSGSSNGSGGPGKDGSFYRSMHVQPVTGRTPMPRRTVMPRLSICVLTEL